MIFYGLCGEGLGHASRTLAVLEHLDSREEVHVFTFGKAFDFLKDQVSNVHNIDGIMFSYQGSAVDRLGTAVNVVDFIFGGLKKNEIIISNYAKKLKPNLFITDFEPTIPRIAKKLKIPCISIDNQHRFAYKNLIKIPWRMRVYEAICGLTAEIMVPCPDKTIISTFHYDLIKEKNNAVVTNGLIRKQFEKKREIGDFILVYLRESVKNIVLKIISKLPNKFIVYGVNELNYSNNIKFKPLGPHFIEDFLDCQALISTAGNQLITEARYCNKSCLVIPEPNQYEQSINAFYVEKLGFGQSCVAKYLTEKTIVDFLQFIPITENIDNGVYCVIDIIREYLNK